MYRLRIKYTKQDDIRFISHLDIVNLFGKAIKRVDLPIIYSGGYNPRPKIDFSFALALGMESVCEYADFILSERIDENEFITKFSSTLPNGIRVISAEYVSITLPSLTSLTNLAKYKIIIDDEKYNYYFVKEKIDDFNRKTNKIVLHNSKKGKVEVEISDILEEISCIKEKDLVVIFIKIKLNTKKNIRPQEILSNIFDISLEDMLKWKIVREELTEIMSEV